ncbi:MAG: hypothetical protein ACOY90_22365 [Candidatus Zhuqueibacterota bacterium]
MQKRIKNFSDWKKLLLNSNDLAGLKTYLDNIDVLYGELRTSMGRVLMSMEMIEIQEILEERIEHLENANKVAA